MSSKSKRLYEKMFLVQFVVLVWSLCLRPVLSFTRQAVFPDIGRHRRPTYHDDVRSTSYFVSTKLSVSSASTTTDTSSHREVNDEKEKFRKIEARLTKNLLKLAKEYDMFEANDHIMVCVSGGKDSATLLLLLLALQQRFINTSTPFQLTAVHLDQGQPGYDGTPLVTWLDALPVPYQIVHEDTYSIVLDKTPTNSSSYCSLCSRLRRGILYTTALSLGCNKIALGHHGDDAVETLLLNMLHGGTMKSMPPRYYARTKELHVLRPLLLCREADIANYVALYNNNDDSHNNTHTIPILPCTLCGSQPVAQRAQVKAWVGALSGLTPHPDNLVRALTHVQPATLMDRQLRVDCGLDPVTGETIKEEIEQEMHENGETERRKLLSVEEEEAEALGF